MRPAFLAIVAGIGLAAATPASAAPREADFPKEVQAVIAEARKECRDADGKGLILKSGAEACVKTQAITGEPFDFKEKN